MRAREYSYEYPRPAVTVDVVLFTVAGALQRLKLEVLLIQRDAEPFRGQWAFPGGFVRENEDLHAAALRELAEETGIAQAYLEQVAAIGTPNRDPRGHTVTVEWVGLVRGDRCHLRPSGDAAAVRWFSLDELPVLAFDHRELLEYALTHLRRRFHETPAFFELLPGSFTLSELQTLTEAILGRAIDRRNFRRKIFDLGLVEMADGTRQEGAHRPAQLYRFVPAALDSFRGKTRQLPF